MKNNPKIQFHLPKLHLRSLKCQWIFSCISLSFIPLVIGAIIFFSNIYNFREQMICNNETLLAQIQEMTDLGFRDIKTIVEDMSEDPLIPIFYGSTKSDNLLSPKIQLKNKLAQYCIYSSYISEIYLYFPERNEFITDRTVADPEVLYYMNYKNQQMSFLQWLSIMKQPHNGEVILLPAVKNKSLIAYIKTIPSFANHVNATIVVILDTQTIATMAEKVSGVQSCEFNILYHEYLVLPPDQLLIQNLNLIQKNLKQSTLPRPIRISGMNGSSISLLPSEVMDFTYLLATPASAYQTPILKVNVLFFIGFLAVIAGSIGFTIHFVKKNYSPIREILQLLNKNSDRSAPSLSYNEYSVIKKALNDSYTARNNMRHLLLLQNKRLLDNSLTMLLHHFPLSENNLQQLKEVLPYDFFNLIIIYQDAGTEEETALMTSEQQQQLIAWLQRENGFLASYSIFSWPLCIEGHPMVLFGLSHSQKEQWEILFEGFSSDILALAKIRCRLYPKPILCHVSSFCTDLIQLPEIWEEAFYRVRYRILFGIDYAIICNKTLSTTQNNGYYYPEQQESKLLNLIYSGNKEEAAALLETLWRINLESDQTGCGYAVCLIYDVMGTLLRACSMISPLSSIDIEIHEIFKKLNSERKPSTMYRYLSAFLGEVCQIYCCEHSRSTDKLKEEILHYIEENYSNPALSVELIGDVFGKSRAYLFSLFKEDTGYSMLYHINRLRIDKAKELLTITKHSKSIQDIATIVGFNSSINFTRAFKKYEGITPSKYREIHLAHLDDR